MAAQLTRGNSGFPTQPWVQQNKNPETPTHNQSFPINPYSLWISPTFINTGPVYMTWWLSVFPISVNSLAFILEDCDW